MTTPPVSSAPDPPVPPDNSAAPPGFSVSITEALPVNPVDSKSGVPVVRPIDVTEVGYTLAKAVLGILAVLTVLLLSWIGVQELLIHPARSSPVYERIAKVMEARPVFDVTNAEKYKAEVESFERSMVATKSVLDTLAADQKQSREFVVQVIQLILLTLYLPVLTALLGYIFGNRSAGIGKGE